MKIGMEITLHIMRLLALFSFLISSRLSYIFFKLKRNTTNKQVMPLANVMFVKSLIFSIMSFLITCELTLYNFIPQQAEIVQQVHWSFGLTFISLLFIGQAYLYWLAEMRNGWH